jgi:hypothetical protein
LNSIFLSASIPDPLRAPEFAKSANTVAISSAVNALLYVTLGRRRLVWGGHPAITPMVWETCEHLGVNYSNWVYLYQSEFFEDDFPQENKRFGNVQYTDNTGELESSLLVMRRRMFSESQFDAAVFMGGMSGIIAEFNLFREHQADAKVWPIASTGGATLELKNKSSTSNFDLEYEFDYVTLFHSLLNISPRERRYESPEVQPNILSDRFWKPDDPIDS